MAPGLLLALATVKPQLVLPLFLWLLLWAIGRRQWTLIASFSGTLAALAFRCGKDCAWMDSSLARFSPRLRQSRARRACPGAPLRPRAGSDAHGPPHTLRGLRSVASAPLRCAIAAVCRRIQPCPCHSALRRPHRTPDDLQQRAALSCNSASVSFIKPHSRLSSALRTLAFVQLAMDFLLVPVAVLGETLRGPSPAWTSLPFLDFLLPSLVAAVLTVETLRRKAMPAPTPVA